MAADLRAKWRRQSRQVIGKKSQNFGSFSALGLAGERNMPAYASARLKRQGIPVVTPCTSCSLMLKEEYHELFGEEQLHEAAQNVYDTFEFLEILQERGEFNSNFKLLNQKLLYHVPCHLKSQAIRLSAQNILEEIDGVKVQTADTGCCGISDNYGFLKDKYEISMKIGAKFFERVKKNDFDKVISDCGTCRMQIHHSTDLKPVHLIEILDKVYCN